MAFGHVVNAGAKAPNADRRRNALIRLVITGSDPALNYSSGYRATGADAGRCNIHVEITSVRYDSFRLAQMPRCRFGVNRPFRASFQQARLLVNPENHTRII